MRDQCLEAVKLDSRIHKIDLSRTVDKILEDDFVLNFKVDGLATKNLRKIPNIYNLMMLLRISVISVLLLSLQSSSSVQSLFLILIEVSFLVFLIKYQASASALKSKVIFWARVLESITLALYGLVCLL